MFVIYWKRLGNEDNFCMRICFIFLMIILLIVAVMMMISAAQLYAAYLKAINIAFPDTFGCIGGFIIGFVASLFFLPPGDPREVNR